VTPSGFPPFDASTFGAQVLWLLICFGVLYVVVARAVQPRMRGILAARRDKIDGDLAEADRLRQATDKAIADYEAALAAARAKAHGIAEETRSANKAELEGKRAGVEADLAHKLGLAETSIGSAKTEALGKVDEIAADTAAALVERLTGAVSADEARAAVASVVGR
jgi:F-type H+-transporting ATPase subunit b